MRSPRQGYETVLLPLAESRLALMRELLASLSASRKAVRAMDLTAIQQETMQQLKLRQEFAEHLCGETKAREVRSIEVRNKEAREESARSTALDPKICAPELHEQLKQTEISVLHALQLQSALLTRAQRKVRVMANMLADPSRNYGISLAQSGMVSTTFESKRANQV